MPTWHSTNGLKRNSENKKKTKDTKKRSPKCWRPFLVYKQSKRFGLIKTILMIYFVFKTSFLAFIFSPANIYPSSFWLLCFIPTFITKTPTIHYQDTHYSLTRRSLFTIYIAIFKLSYQLPYQNKEIFPFTLNTLIFNIIHIL